jgi:thiamine biosynthesis protein ThiS
MKIILNNRDEEFDKEHVSVSEFLILKKFSFKMRIVKINGTFIPKHEYDNTFIKDGDNVQMLYLMSGG